MDLKPVAGKSLSEMTPAERAAEKERVRRLAKAIDAMAGFFPPGTDAVELIREIRRETSKALRAGL
jgi:hypothetical protein